MRFVVHELAMAVAVDGGAPEMRVLKCSAPMVFDIIAGEGGPQPTELAIFTLPHGTVVLCVDGGTMSEPPVEELRRVVPPEILNAAAALWVFGLARACHGKN